MIAGANRGLGLGLTTQYAADGWRVFACCRKPTDANDLNKLAAASGGAITLHVADVEVPETITDLVAELNAQPIDLLLIVAGYYGKNIMTEPGGMQEFGTSDYEDWERILRVNVIGPMRMAEALVENVAASDQKKIVTLSSAIGSIGNNTIGQMYPYRASKAAVNAIMKSMALDLKERGITVIPLHPGWVRTDMGGPQADLDTETSVTGMKTVIDGLTPADAGRFLDHTGKELPW